MPHMPTSPYRLPLFELLDAYCLLFEALVEANLQLPFAILDEAAGLRGSAQRHRYQ